MKLSELIQELSRLPYQHPLTDTNIEAVEMRGTDAFIVTNTSDLANELEDAKASEARFEKDLKEAEEKIDRLDAENEKLTEMHADFKDPESGVTPAVYRERCEAAEKNAQTWRYAKDEAERECTALRKRKGVECGIVRHSHEITTLLGYITQVKTMDDFLRYKADCQKMLDKIRSA